MKKNLLFLLLALFLFSSFGCTKKTEYGAWDGNYIYFYNYRMKTDGTEKTALFDSFSDGKHTYPIAEENLVEAKYHGDYIFLTVSYTLQEDEIEEDVLSVFVPRALLLYNIKDKTSRFVFSTGGYGEYCTSFSVLYYYDDYFVVMRKTTEERTLYTTIDYLGNILSEDDPIYNNYIVGETVFRVRDGYLFYSTLEDREFSVLFEHEKEPVHIRNITNNLYLCDDIIFDPVARKYAVIPWEEDAPHITFDKFFLLCTCETWDTFVYRNVRLYRINEDCTFDLLLTLPDELASYYPTCDGKYIGFSCRKGRDGEKVDYTYNINNGKFYRGSTSIKKEINDSQGVTGGIKCGRYYYNFCSRPAFLGSYTYLARYDTETQETVSMNAMDQLRISTRRISSIAHLAIKPY